MRLMKIMSVIVSIAVIQLGLFAGLASAASKVKVTGVTITEATLTLCINETKSLKATVKPNNASNPKLSWSTSVGTVVSVTTAGVIKGLKVGTSSIVAKAVDDSTKKDTVVVTVKDCAVSSLKLNETSALILDSPFAYYGDDTVQLSATVSPSNASVKTVTWKSSDATVAKVSATGLVTGLKPGKVTITATSNNKKTATATINVTSYVYEEEIDSPTNNTLQQATVLQPTPYDIYLEGELDGGLNGNTPSTDIDYYKFTTTKTQKLTIDGLFDPDSNALYNDHLSVQLKNANGEIVQQFSPSNKIVVQANLSYYQFVVNQLPAGTYTLCVTSQFESQEDQATFNSSYSIYVMDLLFD